MSLECPYCEKEIEDPDDCYEPLIIYDHQCPHCGKYFIFEVEYTRDYYPEQAPCLNDGEHEWMETCGAPKFHFVNKRRCRFCKEEMELKPGDKGYVEVKENDRW